MYLATVIDMYSRKLAGCALTDHMRVSLVIDALSHTHGVRDSLDGLYSIPSTEVCAPHSLQKLQFVAGCGPVHGSGRYECG